MGQAPPEQRYRLVHANRIGRLPRLFGLGGPDEDRMAGDGQSDIDTGGPERVRAPLVRFTSFSVWSVGISIPMSPDSLAQRTSETASATSSKKILPANPPSRRLRAEID